MDEFVLGMMRLKGLARSIDLATLLQETKKLHLHVTALSKFTENRLDNLDASIRGDRAGQRKAVRLDDVLLQETKQQTNEDALMNRREGPLLKERRDQAPRFLRTHSWPMATSQ